LIKFHDSYYSANLMKLVIVGKGSLDVYMCSVVFKYFFFQNQPKKKKPTTQSHLVLLLYLQSLSTPLSSGLASFFPVLRT
jgi:secreted Zn-dependent insulinase-like peptidase